MQKYIVASSGGNDSIALIQWMLINHPKEFLVTYSNTGWAHPDWKVRMARLATILTSKGIFFREIPSPGMEKIIKDRGMWPLPASNQQFCTSELKIIPSVNFMNKIDPERNCIVVTGRRREESRNRAKLALHEYESWKHGMRDVYNPMINITEAERNQLILDFGWEVLPHKSQECYPCICSNKKQLKTCDPNIVIPKVKKLELEMGFTGNGKPKTMFRPAAHQGAVGIEEILKWANSAHGRSKVGKYVSEGFPEEYTIQGIDYSLYYSYMDSDTRNVFWDYIVEQLKEKGIDSKETLKQYEDSLTESTEFKPECDSGYCDY